MVRRIAFGLPVSLRCMYTISPSPGQHRHAKAAILNSGGDSVITDPKDVETLYQQSTDHNKAPQANAGWLLTQLLGSGLGLINGTRWTSLRKTLDPMFSHRTSLQYFSDSLDAGAENYVAGIHQFAKADQVCADGKSIILNATQALQRYPFFEVASMFYGKMSEEEQERLWVLGRRYSEVFAAIVSGGIHRSKLTRYLNTKAWNNARDYQTAWREFNREIYKRRKLTASEAPIVVLTEAAERGELTYNEVGIRSHEMMVSTFL